MHELLLFGQIPSSRHDQVLNILAGVAAMQPQPVLEKHLVFKPNRQPGTAKPAQVGAAQDVQKSQVQALQAQTQGDLFYLQLVADIHGRDPKPDQNEDDPMDSTIKVEDVQNKAPETKVRMALFPFFRSGKHTHTIIPLTQDLRSNTPIPAPPLPRNTHSNSGTSPNQPANDP